MLSLHTEVAYGIFYFHNTSLTPRVFISKNYITIDLLG